MDKSYIKGPLASLLRYAMLFLLLVAALMTLNWIPQVADKGGMREYPDIQQLKHTPGFERVLEPSYFHESVIWPPSMVMGMSRPFMASVFIFEGTAGEGTLVISQSTSGRFAPDGAVDFAVLRQSIEVDLSGRAATLETGLCPGGGACSRVSWQDEGVYVTAFMRGPSVPLLRIARSMIIR